jgi:hypothetical protein
MVTVHVYLRLTVTDTLGVPIDGSPAFDPLAKVTRTFWYRLPADWFHAGRLRREHRERLLDQLYGRDRRAGGDGSRYLILDLDERVLSAHEARGRPWLSDRAAFYVWRDGDVVEEVVPSRL